jgi:hypothetical protein
MATLMTKDKAKLGPTDVKKNIQIHTKAAKNHTAAAKHHMDAAKHYEAGKPDKALVSVGKADAAHLLASAAHTSNIEPIGQE